MEQKAVPLHWLIAGSITGGIVIASLVVVLAVDLHTRYALYRAEQESQAAVQEMRAIEDKWGAALTALRAKADTVNRWRRFMSKSVGGTRP